jgi:hypothetical protein
MTPRLGLGCPPASPNLPFRENTSQYFGRIFLTRVDEDENVHFQSSTAKPLFISVSNYKHMS